MVQSPGVIHHTKAGICSHIGGVVEGLGLGLGKYDIDETGPCNDGPGPGREGCLYQCVVHQLLTGLNGSS